MGFALKFVSAIYLFIFLLNVFFFPAVSTSNTQNARRVAVVLQKREINYIFFSKRSLGTNALLHSVEGLPFSLWAASQPVHTASHIQSDMLKKSSLKLHFLFLSFFHSFFLCLFFCFLIIGNAETSCVCDS